MAPVRWARATLGPRVWLLHFGRRFVTLVFSSGCWCAASVSWFACGSSSRTKDPGAQEGAAGATGPAPRGGLGVGSVPVRRGVAQQAEGSGRGVGGQLGNAALSVIRSLS